MTPVLFEKIDLTSISEGLKRLEEVKEQLSKDKEMAASLDIIDMNDKPGYDSLRAGRLSLVKKRTPLEAERKTAVKPLNDLVSQVNDKYKEYVNAYADLEVGLKIKEDAYVAHHENIKRLKEEEEERKINDKIQFLVECGLQYDPINGYYKNDSGIAVNRQNIITLSEEDFTILAKRANERKVEIEKEVAAEIARKETFDRRKKLLIANGMLIGDDAFVINDSLSGQRIEKHFSQISELNDSDFQECLNGLKEIYERNIIISENFKKDQERLLTEKKKLEDEKLDFEKKQAQAKDLELRGKVKVINDKLKDHGFTFAYGVELLDSELSFSNGAGGVSASVKDLISEGDKLVNKLIYESNALKEELIKINLREQNRIKDEEEKELLQKTIENDKKVLIEANNRKDGKSDSKKFSPFIETLQETVESLKSQEYKISSDYVLGLCNNINAAIELFLNDTKHMR